MRNWLFIAFIGFFAIQVSAQREIPKNLPKFDQKWIHFGFALGVASHGLILDQDLGQTDSLARLDVQAQPGFNINIVSELHLGRFFGLRFTPGISFAARNLEYSFINSDGALSPPEVKTIESTYVDIPLALKFRSARVNNFANYVMLGFKYSIDLASQTGVDNSLSSDGETIVKLRPNNYILEVGVGFDFFLEYFKFSPELKFGYGLNDVSFNDQTIFSSPIQSARARMFVLSFNFEG